MSTQIANLSSDRVSFFEGFENPLLNVTLQLEVPDFIPACKERGIPVSQYFFFHLSSAIHEVENFRYRLRNGKVHVLENMMLSNTVLTSEKFINFTLFEFHPKEGEFLKRSLLAKRFAENSRELCNTGPNISKEDLNRICFFTSLPWVNFTSIQHPVYRFKSNDIPSFAWGKFIQKKGKVLVSLSVQAHHGLVDGLHIGQLSETLTKMIRNYLES